MKKVFNLLFAAFVIVLMQGCFSFSSHQTAETLPEDTVEWGEGVGYYMFNYTDENCDYDGNCSPKDETVSFPYFPETIFRFGLAENMDAGIKVAGVITTVEGDIKFRFLSVGEEQNNFSLAVQPAISGMFLGPATVYKLSAALIASKRINEKFAIYGSFKYNYMAVKVEDDDSDYEDDDSSDSDFFSDGNFYSATIGLSIDGKKFWVRPELTWILDKDLKTWLKMPALGFGLRF